MRSVIKALVCFSLFIAAKTNGQEIKEYVLNHTAAINSISISDTNYSDLSPFAAAIGNSRIVLLGEQDHGDAPTFLAKTRLIKFLHEKLGFEVLAFESDFYSLTKGWEAYKNEKQTIEEVENNIFSLWTHCDACKDLFTYISNTQTTPSPLVLTGFDSQIHGMYRRTHFREDFLNYLQAASAPAKYAAQLDHLLSLVQTTYPLDKNTNVTTDSLLFYGKILDSLMEWNKQLPSDHYFTILTGSLKSYIEQGRFANENSNETLTVRDRQMAANLKWISEHYYPGKKIIVWAHNYHVAKNTYDAMGPKSGRHLSMGNFLFQDLKEQMYILGFTSYEGTAGRLGTKPYAVQKPKKNSIENWLAAKNSEYAFLDFRSYTSSKKEMFYMKGKFHNNALAFWNDVFDGVFYIKHMYPCVLLP